MTVKCSICHSPMYAGNICPQCSVSQAKTPPPVARAEESPRDTQQAPGPHRPSVRALAAMLDTLPAKYEVAELVINGQVGRVIVVCWDGKSKVLRQFDPRKKDKPEPGK